MMMMMMIIMMIIICSCLLAIRYQSSRMTRSQQEITAFTPALYELYVQCSLVRSSLALFLMLLAQFLS